MARDARKARYKDWQSARQTAAEIKWDAINHLDKYLEEFVGKLEARGTKVHWASTGEQARQIILGIVREKKARSIIKSKVMTGEEIHLNEALEKAGLAVVESDFGEYIVQLRHEAPYHFVFPAMHLVRGEISDLFQKELGSKPTDDPEELMMIARQVLRGKYITADVGISGANFAIAETGMISITENEGNARLTCALPKVHIALMGIEKVLPKLEDLALFLPMLATAGAGQALTGYNSFYGGPRQPGESDGPEEFHLVLLDNRRTQLARRRRTARCPPLYPLRRVPERLPDLPQRRRPHLRNDLSGSDWLGDHAASARTSELEASLLRVFPLRRLHRDMPGQDRFASPPPAEPSQCDGRSDRSGGRNLRSKASRFLMNRPKLFALASKLGRVGQTFHPLVKGTRFDPARAWTRSRELPMIAKQTFREFWRSRRR